MEKLPPTFRIDFEDETFGNFIKVGTIAPTGRQLLENISGKKYGRKNAELHTMDILMTLRKTHTMKNVDLNKVIHAAESVLADYYAKRDKTILVFDTDRDEYVIYIFDKHGPAHDYAIRITRMIRGILYEHDLEGKDLFVGATFDYQSLANSLKFEMEEAAKIENYEAAVMFRDIASSLEKKVKDETPDKKKGN